MSFDVTAYRRRAGAIWAGFTSGQKTMLALALAGLLTGGFFFTRWAATPTYTPLYGNLAAADAASITGELTARGVAYKLAEGGATVMVPQDSVYQLRLDMSAKGLPTQGAPGYALLDKQGITTSEFRQRVDFQRALEGELARTIGAIDGVTTATVHLVIPAEDLFTADASKPTASVLLRGKTGAKFSPGQVQAIVHLVASSVEGLQPESVTVADAAGRVLSAAGTDGDAQASKSKEFEDGLAHSIEAMLTPVAGSGGAVVRVNASLDFDERSTTTERFEKPDPSTPLLSESTNKETFVGPGAASASGILGTTPGAATGTAGAASNYQKEQADRSFAVGKVTEQVKSAPGRVSRLSVAVLLDRTTKAKPEEIQALVTAAAGIDPARGDIVEVRQLAFDTSQAKAAETQAKKEAAAKGKSELLGLARTVGILLIVLVALFLAWRSARRASVTRYPMQGALTAGNTDAETLMAAMTAAARNQVAAAHATESLPPAPSGNPALTIGTSDVSDEVGELIDRQPEEVAQILRGWLADRRA
jgi:flagellar M-ring protein FliF